MKTTLDAAHECGAHIYRIGTDIVFDTHAQLEAFAERIRADERASLAAPDGALPTEPFGYITHWPKLGGGTLSVFSATRTAGDSIGCPVTAIYGLNVNEDMLSKFSPNSAAAKDLK